MDPAAMLKSSLMMHSQPQPKQGSLWKMLLPTQACALPALPGSKEFDSPTTLELLSG